MFFIRFGLLMFFSGFSLELCPKKILKSSMNYLNVEVSKYFSLNVNLTKKYKEELIYEKKQNVFIVKFYNQEINKDDDKEKDHYNDHIFKQVEGDSIQIKDLDLSKHCYYTKLVQGVKRDLCNYTKTPYSFRDPKCTLTIQSQFVYDNYDHKKLDYNNFDHNNFSSNMVTVRFEEINYYKNLTFDLELEEDGFNFKIYQTNNKGNFISKEEIFLNFNNTVFQDTSNKHLSKLLILTLVCTMAGFIFILGIIWIYIRYKGSKLEKSVY